MQCEELFDANSELFKENNDEAVHEYPYEIGFCDLISVSLNIRNIENSAALLFFMRRTTIPNSSFAQSFHS